MSHRSDTGISVGGVVCLPAPRPPRLALPVPRPPPPTPKPLPSRAVFSAAVRTFTSLLESDESSAGASFALFFEPDASVAEVEASC